MDAWPVMRFDIEPDIIVREFEVQDAPAIFRQADRDRDHLSVYMEWMTPDYSLASAEEFVRRNAAASVERASLALGIFKDEVFIGSIGFVKFDWAVRKTEIGYWIASQEQGKGIITRACARLIDIAVSELGMQRIEIRCAAENVRSSAVAKRLGFRKEGHLRRSEVRHSKLLDFEIYGLLAEEWKARSQ
jgi:ribosomal-protein-serine acetyltransferase